MPLRHESLRPALLRRAPLASALIAIIGVPAYASAADAPAGDAAASPQAVDLDRVDVTQDRITKPTSVKYTEQLVDTPQSVTLVSKSIMDQQALFSIRDVLSTLPGITFGAGEGGGGYGDSINLRGFSANNDITVDGVRDSAQYTRTDNFNLESLELVNGANSVYSGAGSVGGTINLVSKAAHEGSATAITAGAGSDAFGRVTVDSNTDFGTGTAFRVNAMAHQNDVPGRDVESFERWGIAPSVAFGLGSDTRFTLSYLHQKDDNTPQYGVPYYQNAFNNGPLPGVDNANYYGYSNLDKQDITVDMLTGVLEMDFSPALKLRSLARYQRVDQLASVSATQGTWCLANGINPATGAACAARGTYLPSGPRGYLRDTRNAIAISQTDLTGHFGNGAVVHDVVAGVSFAHETFDLDTGSVLRTAAGAPITPPAMDLYDPDHVWTGPVNYFLTGRTTGTLTNSAVYVFDTVKFGEKWMVNAGARYEKNEGDTTTSIVKTYSTVAGADNTDIGAILGRNPVFENDDKLFSYRAGVVYKPVEAASVYFSYANSKTPSKASVNGACTIQTCSVDPETAVNMELGAKWDAIDGRLALTGAIFRNDRQNYKVADPGNPDNPSGEQQLDGEARVQGALLGVSGQISHQWSVFANYTYLDSEVLQGVSDFVKETTGIDAAEGQPLPNVPKHSASVWTTYTFNDWVFGYGATYQGKLSTASIANSPEIDSYTTHRVMVGYAVNLALSLQLNVTNASDETYFTRVRNNGWATPGDARSAVLTATYRF